MSVLKSAHGTAKQSGSVTHCVRIETGGNPSAIAAGISNRPQACYTLNFVSLNVSLRSLTIRGTAEKALEDCLTSRCLI